MPYEVELPDGTIIQGIPDDMPRSEVRKRILKAYPQFATEEDKVPSPAPAPVVTETEPAPAPVTPTAEAEVEEQVPESELGVQGVSDLDALIPAGAEEKAKSVLDTLTGILEEPLAASALPPALRFLAPTTEEDISSRAIIERGVLSRVRAASDFFGAGSEFSNAIEKRKEEVSKLISAASQGRLEEASRIMEEAEGKGGKAELVAALKAFASAPGEIVGEALATTIPDLIAIAAAAPLGAGAAVGTAVTLGATSGLGIVKGAIYDEVEAALIKQGSSPEEAEKRAKVAQEYFGKNYKEILAGGGLGILATLTGLEKGVMAPIIQNSVSKSIARKIAEGAVKEGVPEFLQGAEEQLARNLALSREGIETDPLKGVVGAGTLEGLAGSTLGAAGEVALSREATEEQATYDARKRDFNKEVNEVTDVEFNEILGGSPDDVDTTIAELEFDDPDREGLEPSVPLLGGPEPEPKLLEGPTPEPEETDGARLGDVEPTPVKPRDTKGRVDDTVKESEPDYESRTGLLDGSIFTGEISDVLAEEKLKLQLKMVGPARSGFTDQVKRLQEKENRLVEVMKDFELRRYPSGRVGPSLMRDLVDRIRPSVVREMGLKTNRELDDLNLRSTRGAKEKESKYKNTLQERVFEGMGFVTGYEGGVNRAIRKHTKYLIDNYGDSSGRINDFRVDNLKEAFSSLDPLADLQPIDDQVYKNLVTPLPLIGTATREYVNRSRRKDTAPIEPATRALVDLLNKMSDLKNARNTLINFVDKEAKRLRSLKPAAYGESNNVVYKGRAGNRYDAARTARKHLQDLIDDYEKIGTVEIPQLADRLQKTLDGEVPNPIQDFVAEVTKESLSNIKEGDTVTFYRTLDKSNPEEGTVLSVLPRAFLINPKGEPPSVRFPVPKKQVQLKESPSDEPMYSALSGKGGRTVVIKAKPQTEKLLELQGPDIYAGRIVDTIAKETMQNSADAIESAQKLGIIKEGKFSFEIDKEARTITIKDNGVGMSTQIIQDAFISIGGSDKQNLSAEESKGGKGLAKMGILGAATDFDLTSVHTAEKTDKVDKNNEPIYKRKKFPTKTIIKNQDPRAAMAGQPVVATEISEDVSVSETGSTLLIRMPEEYKEDELYLFSPNEILEKPLFGDIEVELNGRVLPTGKHFPFDKYQKPLEVEFKWGKADIYLSKQKQRRPSHSVLISGIYQFDINSSAGLSKYRKKSVVGGEIQFDSKDVPYNIIINIKAFYRPGDPKGPYPISNNRQDYNPKIEKDIQALNAYIVKIYQGEYAANLKDNFKDIVSLPTIPIEDEFDLNDSTRQKLSEKYEAAAKAFAKNKKSKKELDAEVEKIKKARPTKVVISNNTVTDTKTKKVYIDEKQLEATFKAKTDAPKVADFDVIFEGKTEDKPIFHNNTNMVFDPQKDEDKEAMLFFSKLGSIFIDIKNTVYELYSEGKLIGNYRPLAPGSLHYVGISIDKKYAGVNIVKPYKAVFLNPLGSHTPDESDMFVIMNDYFTTMVHELAHVAVRSHDADFVAAMANITRELVRAGKEDYYKTAIYAAIADHGEALLKLRRKFDEFETVNRFTSLEDFEEATASRRPEDREVGGEDAILPSRSRREPRGIGDDDPVSFGPESRDPGTVPEDRGGRRGRASRPVEIVDTPSGLETLGSELGDRPVFKDIKFFLQNVLFGKEPYPAEGFRKGLFKLLSARQMDEVMPKVLIGDSGVPQKLKFMQVALRLAGDDIPNFRTNIIREGTKVNDILAKIATGPNGVKIIERLGAVAIEATSKSQDPTVEADRDANPQLAEAYDNLPNDAKRAFVGMKRFYKNQINGLKEDLIRMATRFIDRSTPEGEASFAESVRDIEEQFREIDRFQPYFPLKRFGDFWLQIGDNADPDKKFFVFESELRRDRIKEEYKQYLREQHSFGDRYQPVISGNQFLQDVLMQQVVPHSSEFITRLERIVDRVAANPMVGDVDSFKNKVKESIRQISYLLAASGSFKKMFLNRKAIQGASTDIQRVFSSSVINIAYQRARIRYFTEWNDNLVKANEIITNRIEQDTPQQKVLRSMLIELQERTDQVLSLTPTTGWHKLSNAITNTVFYWFLTAPGSALVNIFGMTNVSLPAIGARYGMIPATKKFMSYAMRFGYRPDFMFTVDPDVRGIPLTPSVSGVGVKFVSPHKKYAESLPPLQQQVLKDLENHIDASFAYDAANLSERPVDLYASPFEKTTRFLAALFHNSEKFNRTVVGLATFDLAYEKYAGGRERVRELAETGGTNLNAYNLAVEEAKYMMYKTLGDFTPSGKAPVLTHPLGKVMLQFKGVSLFLTFNNLRDAKVGLLKMSGDPSVKELRQKLLERGDLSEEEVEDNVTEYKMNQDRSFQEMRKRLFLTSVFSILMAGAKGFAFYGLFKALYELIKYLYEDDEDEAPIPLFAEDFDTVVYEGLKDALGSMGVGEEARTSLASAFMRGAIEEYTGLGIQERISLNIPDLWVRDSVYTRSAEETLREQVLSNLGPSFSLASNFAKAVDSFNQGKYLRAFEDAAPAILKGPLMAGRYAQEDGVKTRTLNTMLRKDELSTGDYILRSIGVAPTKVARETEKRRKKFKAIARVRNEKSNILASYTTATILDDGDMYQKAEQKRMLFNEKYPDFGIEDSEVTDSVNKALQYREQAADLGGIKPEEETFTSTIKGVGE